MARALSFLIRYFSNYYTLHRSDLAARAAPLDPRLYVSTIRASSFTHKEHLVLYDILVADRKHTSFQYFEMTSLYTRTLIQSNIRVKQQYVMNYQ